jgi:hypothetical protein
LPTEDAPLPDPLPPRKHEGLVWHYTSASGIVGIKDSCALWASSPRALNDSSEAKYGWKVVKRAWKDFDKTNLNETQITFLEDVLSADLPQSLQENTYVLSASRKSDLLNQWGFYGNLDGFSLGLRLDYFWAPVYRLHQIATEDITNPDAPKVDRDLSIWEGWFDVIYREDLQRAAATNALRWILSKIPELIQFADDDRRRDFPRFILRSLILQLKHKAFRDEREIRFLASRTADQPPLFREISGRVIPYLPVATIPQIISRGDLAPVGLPVDQIFCGPGVTKSSAAVIESMFPGVRIRQSSIPFVGGRGRAPPYI